MLKSCLHRTQVYKGRMEKTGSQERAQVNAVSHSATWGFQHADGMPACFGVFSANLVNKLVLLVTLMAVLLQYIYMPPAVRRQLNGALKAFGQKG